VKRNLVQIGRINRSPTFIDKLIKGKSFLKEIVIDILLFGSATEFSAISTNSANITIICETVH
jgi:hypothetical protein